MGPRSGRRRPGEPVLAGHRRALAATLAAAALLGAPTLARAQASAAAPPGCGAGLPGATRVEGARHTVAFAPQPAPWALGRLVAVELVVCPKAGAALPTSVRVDARMPDHGHGMNYRPSMQEMPGGRWRAEGLLLHMAGRWQLSIELRDAQGGAETLRHDLQLRP